MNWADGHAVAGGMEVIADRARPLPAPPHVVFDSLTHPDDQRARSWLALLDDEVAPTILRAEEPHQVTWSSLWPSRPRDVIDFEITARGTDSLLRFTLSTPDDLPDPSKLGHLRKRLNHLLFADLRLSYGQ